MENIPSELNTPHSWPDNHTQTTVGKSQKQLIQELTNYGELMGIYNDLYTAGADLILNMEKTLAEGKARAKILLSVQWHRDKLNWITAHNHMDHLISLVEQRELEKDDITQNMKVLEEWFKEDWQEELSENRKKMRAFFNLYLKVHKDFLQLINRYKHEILTRKD